MAFPTFQDLLNGPKGVFVLFDYASSTLAIIAICLVLRGAVQARFDLVGYKICLISHLASGLWLSAVNWLSFIYQGLLMPWLIAGNQTVTKCGADFLRSLQLVGYFANLFNLAAMSTDHYIGILHPIQYVKYAKAARKLVLFIWIFATLIGFADYPVTTALYLLSPSPPTPSETILIDLTTARINSNTLSITTVPLLREGSRKRFKSSSRPNTLTANNNYPNYEMGNLTVSDLENIVEVLASKSASNKKNMTTEESALYNYLWSLNVNVSNINKYPGSGFSGSWCWHHSRGKPILEMAVMALTLICLLMLIVCYAKIFREVRVVVNISSKTIRKLIATTCLLLTTFILCWTPFMVIELVMIIWMTSVCRSPNIGTDCSKKFADEAEYRLFYTIHNVLNTAIIVYPLVDALIYTTRVGAIRKRVLWQFGQCFPCARTYVSRLMTSQRRSSGARNAYKIRRRSETDDESHQPGDHSSMEKRLAIRQELLPFLYRITGRSPRQSINKSNSNNVMNNKQAGASSDNNSNVAKCPSQSPAISHNNKLLTVEMAKIAANDLVD